MPSDKLFHEWTESRKDGGEVSLRTAFAGGFDSGVRQRMAAPSPISPTDELLKAAELAVTHFRRNNVGGHFQGDDEHEAWTALESAIKRIKKAKCL